MVKTWIEGDGDNRPLFKIEWWNHRQNLERRTNNTNEACNFRLTVIWEVKFIQIFGYGLDLSKKRTLRC